MTTETIVTNSGVPILEKKEREKVKLYRYQFTLQCNSCANQFISNGRYHTEIMSLPKSTSLKAKDRCTKCGKHTGLDIIERKIEGVTFLESDEMHSFMDY